MQGISTQNERSVDTLYTCHETLKGIVGKMSRPQRSVQHYTDHEYNSGNDTHS